MCYKKCLTSLFLISMLFFPVKNFAKEYNFSLLNESTLKQKPLLFFSKHNKTNFQLLQNEEEEEEIVDLKKKAVEKKKEKSQEEVGSTRTWGYILLGTGVAMIIPGIYFEAKFVKEDPEQISVGNMVAGTLLITAGAYIIWYGISKLIQASNMESASEVELSYNVLNPMPIFGVSDNLFTGGLSWRF